MEKFRLLKADDIECKVKTVKENGLALLLYKTARTDMDILDEALGPENWSCDYEEIKGNLYCRIGVRFDTDQFDRWVYKSDCGIESREDEDGNQKKGEASDAFKRAGFKWGIGRELYTAPFIWIGADKAKIEPFRGKATCKDRFRVERIEYNERRQISSLTIVNDTRGAVCFNWSRTPKAAPIEPPRAAEKPTEYICEGCGKPIVPYKGLDGNPVQPFEHVRRSQKVFKKCLCIDCIRKNEDRKQ